jgi:hypothetical protein
MGVTPSFTRERIKGPIVLEAWPGGLLRNSVGRGAFGRQQKIASESDTDSLPPSFIICSQRWPAANPPTRELIVFLNPTKFSHCASKVEAREIRSTDGR